MIEIFEGKIGGGKTYSAVARILERFSRGWHVWTNIELVPSGVDKALRKLYWKRFNEGLFHPVVNAARWDSEVLWGIPEAPTMVVIDEAHLWFNSRDWAKASRAMLAFLSLSRKVCVDVIFITQHAENIDAQFRRQALHIYRYRNMGDTGIPVLSWIFAGKIVQLSVDYGGEILEQRVLPLKKEIFQAYDTRSLPDADMREKGENGLARIHPLPVAKAPFGL